MKLKLVYYWSCEAHRGIRGWIWKNNSHPWTHWVTTRINTRIHQASNHISWGWELLYSCPLNALCPFYCLESSSCLLLLLLWPISNFLSFIKFHNSKPNEKRQVDCDWLLRPWCFMFTWSINEQNKIQCQNVWLDPMIGNKKIVFWKACGELTSPKFYPAVLVASQTSRVMERQTNKWTGTENKDTIICSTTVGWRKDSAKQLTKFLLRECVSALQGPVTLFVPEHNSSLNGPH